MNEQKMYKKIRNTVGFLGMILPWLALFTAGIVFPKPDSSWWYSISATYYQSPMLVAVLTSASIVLICYDGYDFRDNLVTTLSGVFGLGIVLFPCKVCWITGKVGAFQLPINISNIIHSVCAIIFFILLAVNSFFLFTLGDGNPTKQKKIRNIIYKICGAGMFITMIAYAILQFFLPEWIIMITEIILLQFFGISWLTKGGIFFKDK